MAAYVAMVLRYAVVTESEEVAVDALWGDRSGRRDDHPSRRSGCVVWTFRGLPFPAGLVSIGLVLIGSIGDIPS